MKKATVVGAGISGLSMAYWLVKNGVSVKVIEKSDSLGGLISTKKLPLGLVESAANGFLPNNDILEMCEEVGVPLAKRSSSRKKKYIFRGRPRKWPLSLKESWEFFKGLLKVIFFKKKFLKFEAGESVAHWVRKIFGEGALKWLVAPALQGVYAGNVERMSASLILKELFIHRIKNTSKFRGTLSPEKGMGQLITQLEDWLRKEGVSIKTEETFKLSKESPEEAVVIATSVFDLNFVIESINLEVESLPLVSATLFFEKSDKDIEGFGCLFPRSEGFYSLGVLFNSSVFENRSSLRSETWILGGAFRKDVCRFSDDEILRQIKEDRKRLYGIDDFKGPEDFSVQRWEKALPHIDGKLEKQLEDLKLPPGVYLSGNYLGRIGLAQIVSRNRGLAEQIVKEFK